MNNFMEIAKNEACMGISENEGGPFGAVIVDDCGNIIAKGNNRVLVDNDPTAHAEIVAIRRAGEKIKNHDLSGFILYTTCEPCPMCLSAIIWSNIKDVYYGCTKKDAADIGFRDDLIYEYLAGKSEKLLNLKHIDRDECIQLFEKYKNESKEIY